MRLVAVNTTVNSVANMTYKSGAIVSPSKIDYIDAPSKIDYIDAPIMKMYMTVISSKLDFVACPSSCFNSMNAV